MMKVQIQLQSRDQFRARMEAIDASLQELMQHSEQLQRQLKHLFDSGTMISYSELSQIAPFQAFELAPGVSVYRIPNKAANSIFFVTTFAEGATLKRHYHDCSERVNLIGGGLIDTISLKNIYTCAEYKPYEPHGFYSPYGCRLLVEIYH